MVFRCIQGSAPVYLQEIMRVRTKLFGDRAFAKAAPELCMEFPSTIPERHHIFRPIQIKIKNILISKWLIFYILIIDFGSYF